MSSNPTRQPSCAPEEFVLSRDRASLSWHEPEARRALSAERLRSACRCAWCTRDRVIEIFPACFAGITIADVALIGGHGLHITFSDGHGRGIFPFRYLSEIASAEVAA